MMAKLKPCACTHCEKNHQTRSCQIFF